MISKLLFVKTHRVLPVTKEQTVLKCINTLKQQGVMHNHARMWVAGITCNMSGTYWREPSRWLHYHLLDGDLAGNTLSWQWIAGTFSHKRYVANQSNIDKYSKSQQPGSWLDVPYENFANFTAPAHFNDRVAVDYNNVIQGQALTPLKGKIALRSLWQLNPHWQADIETHILFILFIDINFLKRWPLSPNRWQFITHWAHHCNACIHHGTVEQLQDIWRNATVVRCEYPACRD